MLHTVEAEEKPYLLTCTERGNKGSPIAWVNGYRFISKETSTRKPQLNETWYCYTIYRSEKSRFILVYPICTEEEYQKDPSLIVPPQFRGQQ